LTAAEIGNRQFPGARNRHQVTIGIAHHLDVTQANLTFFLNLDPLSRRSPCRSTTDVDRTPGQLSTRLTNGLSRDNTHSFTLVHPVTAGQITAVTHGADAVSGRTGHRRASTHLVDPHGLNALYPGFIDHGTRGHENLIALWSHHIT